MMQGAMLFLERLHINHAPLSHFYEPLWLFDGQPPPPVERHASGKTGKTLSAGNLITRSLCYCQGLALETINWKSSCRESDARDEGVSQWVQGSCVCRVAERALTNPGRRV
jgi:hypothetical protein